MNQRLEALGGEVELFGGGGGGKLPCLPPLQMKHCHPEQVIRQYIVTISLCTDALMVCHNSTLLILFPSLSLPAFTVSQLQLFEEIARKSGPPSSDRVF